jgi:hypothetical protein
MKKLLSYTMLSIGFLTLPVRVVSLSATSSLEATVRCEISRVIVGVLSNPRIAHPYDIVEVLINKMNLLLSNGNHDLKVADLCNRLRQAIACKAGACTILSILVETEPLLSPEAVGIVKRLTNAERIGLLNTFGQQIKKSSRGNVKNVEALFRC